VDTPAYRKGAIAVQALRDVGEIAAAVSQSVALASAESKAAAATVLQAINAAADRIDATADELGRMDAIAGDGDHGIGMQRGATAAREAAAAAVANGAGVGTTLTEAADAWADRAGGTSGALWGLILHSMGTVFGDETVPDATVVAEGVAAARDAVVGFGKAQVGDKTMVDTLVPFADALAQGAAAGTPLAEAWLAAAKVARQAAQDTAELLPKIGRARPHAEKSLGTPDPGAISMASIIEAVGGVLG
jgi:dihydroxyacetone kinase